MNASTLCEAFQITKRADADQPALTVAGARESLSWAECAARVRMLAGGLAGLGVAPGDTVALMLTNRPEFHLFDLAAMHLGAVPFSVYPTSSPDQIRHVLSNAGARVMITQPEFLEELRQARDRGGPVAEIVLVEPTTAGSTAGPTATDGLVPAAELERMAPSGFDFDACWAAVRPDDLLTLIYTSGTTGPPRGVEITHANMLAAWRSLRGLLPPTRRGRLVSYLPSAHVFDRLTGHYLALLTGASITTVETPSAVLDVLPQVRPTNFAAVPRIWQKLAARAADLDDGAVSQVRRRCGLDAARWLVSGGAPCPEHLLRWLHEHDLPVRQGWAMSELSGSGAVSSPDTREIGTVGTIAAGVELRRTEDGELWVRGPVVMRGYRGEPEQTAQVLDADGWFATGDIGEIDENRLLRIVGRKKELIINATGKNMSPIRIEAALKAASPLISHAVCIGDGRPYNVALLNLDPELLRARSAEDALLEAELADAVRRANRELSRVEQIKKFAVVSEPWLPGGPELTPTQKLRRHVIADRYASLIEQFYA